jgi:MOSC domain-containing protein YiiM
MSGKIVAIAIKEAHGQPLVEVEQAEVIDSGLNGNVAQKGHRQVTLMSREQWSEVQSELSAEIPWTTRRANILTEGVDMTDIIGKSLKIGDIELKIECETEPCGLMEKSCQGLLNALTPDCRGGVCARVISTGSLKIGDTVSVQA